VFREKVNDEKHTRDNRMTTLRTRSGQQLFTYRWYFGNTKNAFPPASRAALTAALGLRC
jgi:hypothetical protein